MANEILFRELSAKELHNKAIDGGSADPVHWISLPRGSTSTLAALDRRVGSVAYDTTQSLIVVDNGSAFLPLAQLAGAALTNPTISGGSITGALTTTVGVGAKNGATVTAVENGNGVIQKTTLSLASTPVTVANVTGASFGGVKLYDFPEGRILVLGTTTSLSFNWAATDIVATGSGDFSLGSTITDDDTLDTTDVNLLPSSAMLDPFVLGVGNGAGALEASAHIDGTGGAIDCNLNIIIDDADVEDEASDIVLVTGSVVLTWINLGDY